MNLEFDASYDAFCAQVRGLLETGKA